MTGATHFPAANHTAQWFAGKYPGTTFTSIEKLLLHTTEGSGWPAYSGGAIAPNLTAYPDQAAKALLWREHFPLNMSSRALAHTRTQPTNGDHVVQVELIGTCVPGGPGLYWPGAPDWALAGVAELVDFLVVEWGLQPVSTVSWRAYNASGDGQRLGDAAYDAYRGILGHEHAPQNDHRDPGALNVARILQIAKGSAVARTLTDEDIAALAASPVFRGAVTNAVWRAGWGGGRQDGTTEYADWRLWAASHPEAAAGANAEAVAGLTEGPLVDAIADKVVERLGGGSLNVTLTVAPEAIKDAVREVLVEGTGGTP